MKGERDALLMPDHRPETCQRQWVGLTVGHDCGKPGYTEYKVYYMSISLYIKTNKHLVDLVLFEKKGCNLQKVEDPPPPSTLHTSRWRCPEQCC